MKRIICTALCALLLVCTLTGCLSNFDAQAYVQGNMDVVYLNKVSDEYLKSVTNTKEELEGIYQKGLEVEAEYFTSYFSIDLENAPEDTMDKIVELYKKIYANSKYEIGEAEKSGDDYLVNVTVYPIDIMQKVVKEDWTEFEKEFIGKAEQLESMTDAEYEALWCEGIFGLFEARVNSIGYLTPETISIKITKDNDGVYVISDNDFGRIDALVIQY